MAKDKTVELQYKIEGLKRMVKRKVKRQRKNRHRSLEKLRWIHRDNEYESGFYWT